MEAKLRSVKKALHCTSSYLYSTSSWAKIWESKIIFGTAACQSKKFLSPPGKIPGTHLKNNATKIYSIYPII
jgi:hypothetical protein